MLLLNKEAETFILAKQEVGVVSASSSSSFTSNLAFDNDTFKHVAEAFKLGKTYQEKHSRKHCKQMNQYHVALHCY